MTTKQEQRTHWQLQEAKQRFSEVVRHAEEDGPQVITRHGKEVAVLIAVDEYRTLKDNAPDFKAFLLEKPDWPDDVEFPRSRDLPREVEL